VRTFIYGTRLPADRDFVVANHVRRFIRGELSNLEPSEPQSALVPWVQLDCAAGRLEMFSALVPQLRTLDTGGSPVNGFF